jgi:hypothetical protein
MDQVWFGVRQGMPCLYEGKGGGFIYSLDKDFVGSPVNQCLKYEAQGPIFDL